jgi:hypothetical protein
MKVHSTIIIGIIVYTSIVYVLALPTNLVSGKKETGNVLKEKPTLDIQPSAQYNPEYMGGHYQGDMIFPKSASRGAAHRPESQRWIGGVIPYVIRPNIEARHVTMILQAMRFMENATQVNGNPCIQFRPRLTDDDIYIIITNGTGCSAYVGYLPDYVLDRTVTLMYAPPYTCMVPGIIQHELLHVLGFFHEQSRPDRDDYVTVQWANIISGTENNFAKYGPVDIDTLNITYDYGSVMHYEANAFTSNGLRTIIPKDPDAVIGQRVGMSALDILEVQRYYKCV